MMRILEKKIKKLAQEFNLSLILLFGSQASKETHQESDVDLAILSKDNLTAKKEVILNTKFCNLFKTDRVDTVNLKKASPLLLKQILDEYKVLFQENPQVLSRFEARALQKYREAKPLFKMRHEKLKELAKIYDR